MTNQNNIMQNANKYQQFEQYLNNNFDLRRNTITNSIQIRLKGTTAYHTYTETDVSNIRFGLEVAGITGMTWFLRHLPFSLTPEYDPIYDYYTNVPFWDGKDRISELIDTVALKDPSEQPRFQDAIVGFIVGMKARGLGQNHTPQKILVLCGADYIFQSHWLEKLVPEALREYVHILPKSRGDGPTEAEMSSNMLVIAQGRELRSREFLYGLNRMACQQYRASVAVSVEREGEVRKIIEASRLDLFELTDIFHEHQIDMDMAHARVIGRPFNPFSPDFVLG